MLGHVRLHLQAAGLGQVLHMDCPTVSGKMLSSPEGPFEWEGEGGEWSDLSWSIVTALARSLRLCRHEPNGAHVPLIFLKRLAHRQDSFARRRVTRDVGNEFEESP